jgi:hypothetical protein
LILTGTVLSAASKPPVIIVNPAYRLVFNSDKGTIESLRVLSGSYHELLIPGHNLLPLF